MSSCDRISHSLTNLIQLALSQLGDGDSVGMYELLKWTGRFHDVMSASRSDLLCHAPSYNQPSQLNAQLHQRDMTGPDRRSGAMMSKVGNPQIYEDHEQRYVSLPHIQFEHPH